MNKFVFFKSITCGPCKLLSPVVEYIVKTHNLDIENIFIDDPAGKEEAVKYGVTSIPTIIKINEFNEMSVSVGYKSKNKLESWMLE